MSKIMKKKSAFTLLEVMVVTIIVGILAALALPNYFLAIERMRANNARQTLLEIYAAQKRYFSQNGTWNTNTNAFTSFYAANISALGIVIRPDAMFTVPAITQPDGTMTFNASITRNSLNPCYTLNITQASPTITCTPINPANICTKLGF